MFLGKYNQSKTVRFRLFQVDGVDFEPAATFAAGDIKIMKDEGAEANTTNLPTDEGQGYSLVLTASEMSAARIEIYIVDQTGTKVWLDTGLSIETYGHASAEHAFDMDTAAETMRGTDSAALATNVPDVISLANINAQCDTALSDYDGPTNAELNARTLAAASYFDPAANAVANVTLVATTTTNTDMRGTDSAATAANLATVDTNVDAILVDTAVIGTAGAGLTDLGGMSTGMKAEVNAEALDVLVTDTFAELGGVPAATSSIKDKLNWIFMLARNKIEQTATTTTVRADDTTTSVATSTVSDDGTTATRGELI